MKKLVFFITLLSLSLLSILVSAQTADSLLITEVMPNPAGLDSEYEWIELTNFSGSAIDLSLWQLNGTSLPSLTIGPSEIIVLVRNEPSFYQRYSTFVRVEEHSFSLGNSGATLSLTDGNTTSEFTYPSATEEISFELLSGDCNTITEHVSSNSVGAPNTSCLTPSTTPNPIAEYPNKVFISGIDYAPQNGDEWLEITNQEDFAINLGNWIIEDKSNNKYIIPDTALNASETVRIFPTTVSLNNNGDTIYLFTPTGIQIDIYSYDTKTVDTSLQQIVTETKNETTSPVVTITPSEDKVEISYQIPRLYLIGEY
ncbi:lamin tail domain-containing protein [Candidatus Dojkabacteria bacterium]|uniref:Lamin tail domain-containing protein n=1 Tax=Candidatus Dojkabacteria bacterium TaxID=2099670 RepID=A0A955RJ91_9BACT|nr:lamin tail domain-containing protein [Candidatus Dojkabacteria bacterium]